MIDLHSHILPKTDDGSTSMKQTVLMLREARYAGFTSVVSTSHYMEGCYEANERRRHKILQKIRTYYKYYGVHLYLGSEIYYSENMINLLKEKKASTINHSRYVLFEFSLSSRPLDAKELIYRLIENDYIPIVAHPERYPYVQKDISFVKELLEMGALFQANYGSIIGLYGSKAEQTLKKLLNEDYIQFFGTDAHRDKQVYANMDKAIKKIKKIISEEKFEELSEINPRKVLNDEDL